MSLASFIEESLLLFALTATTTAFPSPPQAWMDRDHGFHAGRGGMRGNEHSERPGHLGVGRESYGGNGCPQGTMQVVFAPDLMSFTMIFDQFVAQVGDASKGPRDNMSCDTIIPITVPAGQQMEITRVDFRGFAALPNGARGQLQSVFNFRGMRGDRDRINMRYTFQGPMSDDYTISSDTVEGDGKAAQTEVSPCGGDAQLRVSTRLQLVSRDKGSQAQITLDSVDASTHAVYFINWRSCSGGNQ